MFNLFLTLFLGANFLFIVLSLASINTKIKLFVEYIRLEHEANNHLGEALRLMNDSLLNINQQMKVQLDAINTEYEMLQAYLMLIPDKPKKQTKKKKEKN